jgi:asparagine synthase (glutamine-hydrolysing)
VINRAGIDQRLFCQKRDTLHHRGPDGKGDVFLQGGTIALGHTRLSFIDLSENGRQPMADIEENIWVTYNGEIYNYLDIREELIRTRHHLSQSDGYRGDR